MNKQTINRIPRPMGTTELSKSLKKQGIDIQQINKIITNHIVSHYINTTLS